MFERLRKALGRTLGRLPFPGRPNLGLLGYMGLPGERDYTRLVGDGGGNSIVMACIQWIGRTFPEAPPIVWKVDSDGVRTPQVGHDVVRLMRYPTSSPDNPGGYYSGVLLWMATLTSYVLDGNAYWLKVRSAAGRVVQLWYVPHYMMEPRWPMDGSQYISHYDYMVGGRIIPVAPSEVVHFRNGLDYDNPRKGRSPLAAVLREVYSDDEAARFTASLLKNLGMPGVILAPDTQAPGVRPISLSQEEADKTKARFREAFGGDNRGEPMVMSGPTKVVSFGFSPKDLDLSALRDIPEERITANLGLPAAVIGLGAGLANTAVGATMKQLRDQAWQSNLIPMQRLMSEEIQTQLMPDFVSDLIANEFGFDLSRVKVLQDDAAQLATRWADLVRAGIAKRKEARSAFGLPSGPEDDIYLPQPGVKDEMAYVDAQLGITPPAPVAPVAPAGATPPAPPGQSAKEAELEQRVKELEAQAVAAKAAGQPNFKAIEYELHKGMAELKALKSQPIHLHLDAGAVQAPIELHSPDVMVEVDARTTVEKGSTQVQVDTPADHDTEILRDESNRIIGQRQRRAR